MLVTLVPYLLTIAGWIVAFVIGARLNKKNLKQHTIVETIKYIHSIKQSLLDDLSKGENPNIQFVTQKIKRIRILLKEVVSKKLYEEEYNLIINRCRGIMKKRQESHELPHKVTSDKIMIELHKLDALTLLYPFYNTRTR